MHETLTQADRLLAYLRLYRTCTPAEATAKLGIRRLQTVVFKLRKRGYEIRNELPRTPGPSVYRLVELNRRPR